MSSPSPFSDRAWIVVLGLAVAWVLGSDLQRLRRLQHVATISRGDSVPNAGSPTGYAGGVREWVLPDHDGDSYGWIAQTQQMFERGEWRVRRIESENAPFGREVHAASPYRWWLGLVAWGRHLFTGGPRGIAVEEAAGYADPLLHLVILLGFSPLVARHFGSLAASLFAAALALLFPFTTGFFPGAPDDLGLQVIAALGSVLPLLIGIKYLDAGKPRRTERWFMVAGIAGGIGLWFSPPTQFPLLLGVALGGLFLAWIRRPAATPVPWRFWSLSGALTVLAASLAEYFPHYLGSWELRAIHPLYGLAWLGGGELLVAVTAAIQSGWTRPKVKTLVIVLLALTAVAALPAVMLRTGNPAFLFTDLQSFRLTKQADGAFAAHVGAWLREDGLSAPAFATLLPLLLLAPALMIVGRRHAPPGQRSQVALALGPVFVGLVFACLQLRWWTLVDALLLVLLVAASAELAGLARSPFRRWLWIGGTAFVLLVGGARLVPSLRSGSDNALTASEAAGLMERDLAHWLARRAVAGAPPVVHAPPALTTTLAYYGGLRGLGTLSWESNEGLSLAIRVAISTSRDEARALLLRRGVTHLVLTSWDGFYDNYTRASSMQVGELFYNGLNRFSFPPWLRPLPYPAPKIPGLESHAVRILELVDDQDEPLAAARLTEYFIEMGQLENARATRPGLLRYPADLGVLVARAQLEIALQDGPAFSAVFEPLVSRLAGGADRNLNWERRVSLAVVLAKGQRADLARAQLQRCLAEATETRLRSLTTNGLFYLLALNKNFGLQFSNPHLQESALQLLPEELRQSL